MKPTLTPAAWLDSARAASEHLVAQRTARVRPPRRQLEATPRPKPARALFALAAFGFALVLFSGAWAFIIHRDAPRAPAHPAHPASIAPPSMPAAPSVAPVPAPLVSAAPVRRMKRLRPRPIEDKPVVLVPPGDDEPLGDVIYGKPPSNLPPLFTTEEYKSRGILQP